MKSNPCQAAFEKWWEDGGKRFCQSLLVCSENASVRDKIESVWCEAWFAGVDSIEFENDVRAHRV